VNDGYSVSVVDEDLDEIQDAQQKIDLRIVDTDFDVGLDFHFVVSTYGHAGVNLHVNLREGDYTHAQSSFEDYVNGGGGRPEMKMVVTIDARAHGYYDYYGYYVY